MLQREFFRNVLTLISGSGLAQLIPFLAYPVLTRLFTTADFGILALYLSILGVLVVFSTARYELSVMLPASDRQAAHLLALALVLSIVFSVLIGIVVFFFRQPIAAFFDAPSIAPWFFFLPFSIFFVSVFQSFSYWSNRKKYFRFIAAGNINQSLTTAGVKLGTGAFGAGAGGLIGGSVAGQGAAAALLSWQVFGKNEGLFRGLKNDEVRRLAKKYSVYPKYNMPHALANTLSGNLPVFVFTSFFSTSIAGIYSLAFSIGFRPLSLIANSFLQVLSQKVIQRHNESKPVLPLVKKTLWRSFLLAILPFILLEVFAPQLFAFIFGNEWREAGNYLRILAPWLLLVFLVSPLSFLPELFFKQKKAMIIDFVYLVLRIAALSAGVLANSVWLALLLFSLSGVGVLLFNLFWYLSLARRAGR